MNWFVEFNRIYDDLYEGRIEEDIALVDEFDTQLHSNKEFKDRVCEFIRFRGDPITSDRECMAYMLLLKKEKDFN